MTTTKVTKEKRVITDITLEEMKEIAIESSQDNIEIIF